MTIQIAPFSQPIALIPSLPLITGDDLALQGDIGPSELIKGKVVQAMPTGYLHGVIEFRFGKYLGLFLDDHDLGHLMGGEVGLYTARNPDTVRAADVAFISHERFAQLKSHSYLDVAPELIVEVTSPDDRWQDIMDKLGEYFAIGVKLVWVVYPQRQQVHVYRSLTEIQILKAADTLTAAEILPGFSLTVGKLFK